LLSGSSVFFFIITYSVSVLLFRYNKLPANSNVLTIWQKRKESWCHPDNYRDVIGAKKEARLQAVLT
jgi:hypothetical protein